MVVVVAVGAKADTPVIDSVARRKDLMVALSLFWVSKIMGKL